MNILSTLRDKIGAEEIKLLSGFLGENEDTLAKSTDLSITSMLQGLIRHVDQGSGLSDIMNVIRDGGHSGDILDDLKGLFTNQDKTQLLVTIGNNINNHFFGNTSTAISDKVAEFGGIKKTSAASLFSLCSPLVLGLIGKQVKSARMTQTDLSHLLQDQKETVQSQLPPAINTVYDQKHSALNINKVKKPEAAKAKVVKKEIVKENFKSSNSFGVLAWILLAALVLAAAYYSFRNRAGLSFSSSKPNEEIVLDSLNNDVNSTEEVSPMETSSDGAAKDESDAFDNIQNTNSATNEVSNATPEKKEVVKVPETKVVKSSPPLALQQAVTKEEPKETNTAKAYGDVLDQLGASNSWASLSSSNFKGSSAELKSNSELKSLADFLKINSNKKLQIAGMGKSRSQEDRAYAVQGKLYEMGVPLSQLQIVAGQSSVDGSVKMKVQ